MESGEKCCMTNLPPVKNMEEKTVIRPASGGLIIPSLP